MCWNSIFRRWQFFICTSQRMAYFILFLVAGWDYINYMISKITRKFMLLLRHCSYLVDPASSHRLVLKIKPCMSKCYVFVTLDCGRLIITVIVLLRLLYRWIPVVIAFFWGHYPLGNPPIDRWFAWVFPPNDRWISWVIHPKFSF